jgi:hypothetical protein
MSLNTTLTKPFIPALLKLDAVIRKHSLRKALMLL